VEANSFDMGQHHVLEKVARGGPLSIVLEAIVLLVEQQAEGMLCSVLLVDEEHQTLASGVAPSLPSEYRHAIDGTKIVPEMGSCGAAAHLRERIVVEHIAMHPNWARFRDLALNHRLSACVLHADLFAGAGAARYLRDVLPRTPRTGVSSSRAKRRGGNFPRARCFHCGSWAGRAGCSPSMPTVRGCLSRRRSKVLGALGWNRLGLRP
jgi:hypothetical protein